MVCTDTPIVNRLLRSLPRAQYQSMESHLEPVDLKFGDVLYDVDAPMQHVYFPNDTMISLLTKVDTHRALEVGMVGPEGVLGASLALGASVSAVRALAQGSGSAMRLKSTVFLRECRRGLSMQKEVLLYAQTLMSQIAQTAACNRFHAIEPRLARWLLMTRDRLGSDRFYLTQDYLSAMLGVRRVGVSNAAHLLKLRQVIDYSRGNIEIMDVRALKSAACSCYTLIANRHGSS